MIKKYMGFDFYIEALLLLLVFVIFVAILFKVVIPNFSAKSLTASWMAMLGAFVIFCYALFFELQNERIYSSFNTLVCAGDDIDLPNLRVPCFSHGQSGVDDLDYYGSIIYNKNNGADYNLIDVGTELIILNVITFITSDYKDWRMNTVSAYGASSSSWRKSSNAGDDSVIYEKDVLNSVGFKFFRYVLPLSGDLNNYSIFPPGTQINTAENIVSLANEHYTIEIAVYGTGHRRRNQVRDLLTAGYEVQINCNLLKKRAGSFHRAQYKEFCQKFAESLRRRLEVAEKDFPEYLK